MLRQTVVLTENAYLSRVTLHLFISADGLFLDWGHCVRHGSHLRLTWVFALTAYLMVILTFFHVRVAKQIEEMGLWRRNRWKRPKRRKPRQRALNLRNSKFKRKSGRHGKVENYFCNWLCMFGKLCFLRFRRDQLLYMKDLCKLLIKSSS